MAKGLRSHIKQKHKTKLRNTVFAPVIDARTERLSKKLQEIAAQPREAVMEDVNVVERGGFWSVFFSVTVLLLLTVMIKQIPKSRNQKVYTDIYWYNQQRKNIMHN